MSSDERSHIDNAIWLCANHATLIDRDAALYTAISLRAMKRTHEQDCADQVRSASGQPTVSADLLAIGPQIVGVGKLLSVDAVGWSMQLEHFIMGDVSTLITFIETFDTLLPGDQYIIVNGIGDGRVLAKAPSFRSSDAGWVIRCPIVASFPRTDVKGLADIAFDGDLVIDSSGDLALVTGPAALSQRLRLSLSVPKRGYPGHPEFGTRLAEYYAAFRESPWLDKLFKLEVIRQASIPYHGDAPNHTYTPLQCVERVWSIDVLTYAEQTQKLLIRADLSVKGLDRWQCEIPIFLPAVS